MKQRELKTPWPPNCYYIYSGCPTTASASVAPTMALSSTVTDSPHQHAQSRAFQVPALPPPEHLGVVTQAAVLPSSCSGQFCSKSVQDGRVEGGSEAAIPSSFSTSLTTIGEGDHCCFAIERSSPTAQILFSSLSVCLQVCVRLLSHEAQSLSHLIKLKETSSTRPPLPPRHLASLGSPLPPARPSILCWVHH